MKKLVFFGAVLSFLIINPYVSYSGEYWAKVYDGFECENGGITKQTSDGGFISAGSRGTGVGVMKLESDGDITWKYTYSELGDDAQVGSLQFTSDNGYILAGWTNLLDLDTGGDIWAMKLTSAGSVSWIKTYGTSETELTRSIQQTTDGGYIIAGYTYSTSSGLADIWIIKLDQNGNVSWQKTYGGNDSDQAFSIQQTTDGGYIVAGYACSYGAGGADFWVLKLTSTGSVSWQKTYGGTAYDMAFSIKQTSDGGYVVAGQTASYGAGSWDYWILKLTSTGTVSAQKAFGKSSADSAHYIEQISEGGYIITGYTTTSSNYNIGVLKLDSSLNVVWQKKYGDSGTEQSWIVQQLSDGSYMIGGGTYSFGYTTGESFLLKVNSLGDIPGCSYVATNNMTTATTAVTGQNTSTTVSTSLSYTVTTLTSTPSDPYVPVQTICSATDTDDDGVPDGSDNCPTVYNPTQTDADNDTIGDACDTCPYDAQNDIDNDTYCACITLECPSSEKCNGTQNPDPDPASCADNCPNVCNSQQLDADNDTIGDVCDSTPGCGGCGQVLCETDCGATTTTTTAP